jgi:hypothetical protein
MIGSTARWLFVSGVLGSMAVAFNVQARVPGDASALRPVSAFDSILTRRDRSIALFIEAGKVFQSPRCLNCHPVTRAPTQGTDLHPHSPPAPGGEDGRGIPGLPCAACHHDDNVSVPTDSTTIRSIPGDPKWGLAPASMAWQGQSLSAICAQVKDPTRNGGRTLAAIQEHVSHDHLVGWAWHPGPGRQPAPDTQAAFGAIVQAWIASGAECPP